MPDLVPLRGHVEEKRERKTSDVGFCGVFFLYLKEQLFVIMNQKYKISLKQQQVTEYG